MTNPVVFPVVPVPDQYSAKVFSEDYYSRQQVFFRFIQDNPAPENPKSIWFELARLWVTGNANPVILQATLETIASRQECSDLALLGLIRLLYQFYDSTGFPQDLIDKAWHVIKGFRYWPDEPGTDNLVRWTESRYICFATCALLSGQIFPDQVFTNSGKTGFEKMPAFRNRIIRWMDLRFYSGFTEWLSHVAYDDDLAALLNLVDFCNDEEIQLKATILVDLLLFEMAIHNHNGVFSASRGRSFEITKKWASQEYTTDTQKLIFGRGIFGNSDNISAVSFALSKKYRIPKVLYDIATDNGYDELLHRQRNSIRLDQAAWWDLKPTDFERGLHLMAMEAYLHPCTAKLFLRMLKAYRLWEHPFFSMVERHRALFSFAKTTGLLPQLTRHYQRDLCRMTRDEVNLYTYKTADYILSSAQDYHKGFGGSEQHIWQATLGPDAVCFTTHPTRSRGSPPDYWTGSGNLPRVGQVKNVLIAIYRIKNYPSLLLQNELFYTHAWLPRDRFEEVVELDGWVFARFENAYLALLSQHPYEWHRMPGENQNREIIVRKANNIWLCELGRKAVDGEFNNFIQRIIKAQLLFSKLAVHYESPSQGLIQFSWKGPLMQMGREISQLAYPRYASPYVQATFPPDDINIKCNGDWLKLDWMSRLRQANDFIN